MPLLTAIDLTYHYPQNGRGLPPVSLSVEPGEALLISGPSGCGKSTLARCLTGFIPHLYHGEMRGEVWLNGQRTTEVPLWQLSESAGLLFQNPAAQMLTETVEAEILFGLENLGLSRETMRQRLEETLQQFGLMELRGRDPQTLSGGEQQKLALAAVMARQPKLLVLDEPFSMLDTTAAIELVAELERLVAAGTAVIICEHRAEYLADLPDLQTIDLSNGHAVPVEQTGVMAEEKTEPVELVVKKLKVARNGRTILHDLNFRASGGQIVAIVGRNGVGKTTLLRALTGLQDFNGRVTVNNEPPDLGLVFQNPDLQLFNASVRDEILYQLPNPDLTRYQALLAALGLARYEETPPLLLSEGEKKRLALATVLMRQPRHGLLLDEPSLGQDAAHKAMLLSLLRQFAAGGQIVMITTHDIALAAQSDRMILLGSDGFVADGPPQTVLADGAAWRQVGLVVPEWLLVKCQAQGERSGLPSILCPVPGT
ncbi:MAG: ATP-binding cassette domain-containing protein [Ardenticatenaceae bacterium]|nr:ATP-binding cassette domain-containing protein [Ardenticatenaceae bacterium]